MHPIFTIKIHYQKNRQILMKRESTVFTMIVRTKLKIQ